MTHYITSRCLGELNRMCIDICPVQCVHIDEGVDRMCFIDPSACIDCGACVSACPESAIYAEGDLPASEAAFARIGALYFRDRAAARALLPGAR